MNIAVVNLQKKIHIPSAKIKSAAQEALIKVGLGTLDLIIVVVGEQRMRTLNREYLGHDYVTDVITFDLEHGKKGEIIVCPSVAARNAKGYGVSVQQEILLYVIHGILHLAGYDDHAPKDIERMRAKERELLGASDASRPRQVTRPRHSARR